VLSLGEDKTHRYPARLVYGGVQGETPLVWSLVSSSRTPGELRKKFRQLGVKAILYNFASADWLGSRYWAFTWTAIGLRRYAGFLKRHVEVVSRPDEWDLPNGGFYVYRISDRPLTHPRTDVWFMPGTEAVFGQTTRLKRAGRLREALAACESVLATLPDFGHARNEVGRVWMMLGDFPKAFGYLKKCGEAGVMDTSNLPDYGAAAMAMGKHQLAGRVLEKALTQYPVHRRGIRGNLILLKINVALSAIRDAGGSEAERLIDEAESAMGEFAVDFPGQKTGLLQTWRALAQGCRGEMALARGDRPGASRHFTTAAALVPGSVEAKRWLRLAAGAAATAKGRCQFRGMVRRYNRVRK